MATVQDRLRQTRTPLDKWSIREQLCLASAVSCSGDQNWMTVSRTIKLVCGNGINSKPRPNDWYSQKSCAVQYGHLLENVETPKRKKRCSESSGSESTAAVDTPTDLVLRKLTEERIQELKDDIRQNQEEYAKLYKEIKELQAGNCSEERLMAMWREMEQEEEAKNAEEKKLEKQMREREQHKQEMQRTIRTITPVVTVSATKTETAPDAKETAGIEKSKLPLLNIQSDSGSQTQQPQTSPLLSSLLKSPTGNMPAASSSTSSSSARTTAPTITNLLTGGALPSVKQPVVIVKNIEMSQLLTRPISGPPIETAITGTGNNAGQNLLSPSQCAPTLSMLLEKTKTAQSSVETEESIAATPPKRIRVEQAEEANENKTAIREEAHMETTEEMSDKMSAGNNPEVDETEEQQLLEVFKSIGNIELEIDAAFLTAMEEEPPTDNADITSSFDIKTEATNIEESTKDNIKADDNDAQKDMQIEVIVEDMREPSHVKENVEKETIILKAEAEQTVTETNTEKVKVETISSDDSNDNIPLATVVATKSEGTDDKCLEVELTAGVHVKSEEVANDNNIDVNMKHISKESKKEESAVKVETDEGINIGVTDKSEYEEQFNEKKQPKIEQDKVEMDAKPTERKEATVPVDSAEENSIKEENQHLEENSVTEDHNETVNIIAQTVIPLPDTDTEDSCTPDVDKSCNLDKVEEATERKRETRMSESSDSLQMTTPTMPISTPARPIALRKLRERDRSESPMIGEEESEHASITTSRLRRRGCSTPVMDSVPNSPASMSDREEKELRTASKKSLLGIFNAMQQKHIKNITLLEQSFNENISLDEAAKYEQVCLRPMDFQVIHENIESSAIRSTLELQRDILLMCQNAIMLYAHNTEQYRAAMQIKKDCRNLNDLQQVDRSGSEKEIKEREHRLSNSSSTCSNTSATPNTSGIKARSGSRKSLRIP